MKILFICSANTDRSPTFHNWFAKHTDHEIKSCGISHSSYDSLISEELLEWADKVYVMSLDHEIHISKIFPQYLDKVEIIGCSDQYSFEEPDLIKVVEFWAKKKGFEIHEEKESDSVLKSRYAKLTDNYNWNSWIEKPADSNDSEVQISDELENKDDSDTLIYDEIDNIYKAIHYLAKKLDDHVMAEGSKVIDQEVTKIIEGD